MVGLRLKMSVFLLTYQDDWAPTTKGGWGGFQAPKLLWLNPRYWNTDHVQIFNTVRPWDAQFLGNEKNRTAQIRARWSKKRAGQGFYYVNLFSSNIFGPNSKTCTWKVRAAWGLVSRGLTVMGSPVSAIFGSPGNFLFFFHSWSIISKQLKDMGTALRNKKQQHFITKMMPIFWQLAFKAILKIQ